MTQTNTKPFFLAAIDNIVRHGDTDIFPFPLENHILRDKKDQVIKLLRGAYSDFDKCFSAHPPRHIKALAPVGSAGFRWASQLDPFWNAYFLGVVLAVAPAIEAGRIAVDDQFVYSYRLDQNYLSGDLFRSDVTWKDFINQSIALAAKHKFVLVCDIADCYQRISHHQLENALAQLHQKNSAPDQIRKILQNYSQTKSYGVPVGGPAARLLVELVLGQTDGLLKSYGFRFCRYADDYHIFAESRDDAYRALTFISEKFLRNEGLSLQKSKTRIMSGAEFISSSSLLLDGGDEESGARALFGLKLKFDPYSPTKDADYEELKAELSKIDILSLLSQEIAKTRVHGALTRRIVSAVRLLDPAPREQAVITLADNLEALYPIFPVVAITIRECFETLSQSSKEHVCAAIRDRVISKSYVLGTDLHAAYAARILGLWKTSANTDALVSLHSRFQEPLVRRDIILIMANWKNYAWLNDQFNDFQSASPWERRAFIVASFFQLDSGSHWRSHHVKQFNSFELLVRDWVSERYKNNWQIPL